MAKTSTVSAVDSHPAIMDKVRRISASEYERAKLIGAMLALSALAAEKGITTTEAEHGGK